MEELQNIENAIQADWVSKVIAAVVIVVATALLAHLVTRFLRHLLHESDANFPSSSIFVNIGRAVVWILGVSIMLDTCFNVNVSAIVAALGVGGIAISLGFQDTIANLIGGLQVSIMRIIQPGDNIEVGTDAGVVKDITWRHTTITNSKGEEIIIPNSIINKTALVHLPPVSQITIPISVTSKDKTLTNVAEAIEAAALKAAGEVGPLEKNPVVRFSEIGDVAFRGTIIFTMKDGTQALAARDAVVRATAPLTRPAEGTTQG